MSEGSGFDPMFDSVSEACREAVYMCRKWGGATSSRWLEGEFKASVGHFLINPEERRLERLNQLGVALVEVRKFLGGF